MRRCLIVVDYQQEFVAGRHGFPDAREIDRAIAGKILDYRAAGDDVLFTLDAAGGSRLYGTVGACLRPTDRVFRKSSYGSNALYRHLRRTAYRSIEVAGVVSSVCVLVNAVLIPQKAVLITQKGSFVMTLDKDNVVGTQKVEVSETIGDMYLVDSGLKGGERIICEGMVKARPGAKVSVMGDGQAQKGQAAQKTAQK